MSDLVKQNLVVLRRTEFWIEVEIKTDILFPSGSAQLAPYAVDVIQRLGGALAPFPNPIRVEGHTDNKPIKTVAFYSNWELSAARAGSVVRVLQARGVGPERLAVIGYGEQRPIQSNDTEQGRNANRRVVVVILSTELQRRADPAEQAAGAVAPIPPASATAVPTTADTTVVPAPSGVAVSTNTSTSSLPQAAPARAPLAAAGEPAELPTAHTANPPGVTQSTAGAPADGMVRAP
jgi:chemotaxis protein MotB